MDTPTNRYTHPQPCTAASSDTNEAILPPPCVAAVQQRTYSSSRCVSSRYVALHRFVVKAPWVQKAIVRKTSNTHSHEHTRSSTHPHTHRPNHPPMDQPTHPRRATAIQQSTAADALIQTELLCRTLGFPLFYDSPPSRGASDPSPGGQRTTPPARRVGHGTRYSLGTEKGCCVCETWHHSETAGGRVELETRSCFLGVL